MNRGLVLASALIVTGAIVAFVLVGPGSAPNAPDAPAADGAPDARADADHGEPDAGELADATTAADAAPPADDAAALDKRLLGEVVESWPGPDTIDADPKNPISDEDWAANPCRDLAEMVIGTIDADNAKLQAQAALARAHHPRNVGIDLLTWTYAGCRAVAANDLSICHTSPLVTYAERCEDHLMVYRIARAPDAETCIKDTADLIEAKRDPLVFKQLCRAATGDGTGCRGFRHPEMQWYCDLLVTLDASGCAQVSLPEARRECPSFVALVRAVRGLPKQDVALDPDMPMTVIVRRVSDPDFSCADWYRGAMRALCR